jgi:hypothetical protein
MLGRAPANLRRPIYSMTGALIRQKPNSRPKDRFPSLNFTKGDLTGSVHGDSGHRRYSHAFPVILGTLAQLGWSGSIRGTQECWNKIAGSMNRPRGRWPRWGQSEWCSWVSWGKWEIGALWWTIGGTTCWLGAWLSYELDGGLNL